MRKIEQVYGDSIITDSDERLSPKDIREIVNQDIPISQEKNPYQCVINGKLIQLYIKQITYLGHPHSAFKKRIQISRGWQIGLRESNAFLLGVYKYRGTVIYTIFDTTQYVNRITNNSSAHVSTFDLLNAQEKGVFTKRDIRGNLITCVRRGLFTSVLGKLVEREDILSPEILLFNHFKNTLQKEYDGISCYKEMISNSYRNMYQAEWFGFFLEYQFELFLNSNPNYKSICRYQSEKFKEAIDLDLNFNNEFFGDLKTHSNASNAILGNDKSNIESALEHYKKIWYVVFNHNTFKDEDYGYEVTLFWNQQQGKEDPMSYSKRMKHHVELTDFMILEINRYNEKYLSVFNQGLNSNGLPREPKIKINKNSINNFLIFKSPF